MFQLILPDERCIDLCRAPLVKQAQLHWHAL